MSDPRDRTPGFRARHPRATSALYQVGLCVTTYVLIYPIGHTMERVCARVDEFDFWIVDVYVCRILEVVLPNFLAYPSTATVITATILFYAGMISLTYHNRNDVLLRFSILYLSISIGQQIIWEGFFAWLEQLPPRIWGSAVSSALIHPIFRWAFPDFNAFLVRSMDNFFGELKNASMLSRKKSETALLT